MLLTLVLNIATIVRLRHEANKPKLTRCSSNTHSLRKLNRMTAMLLAASLSFIAFGAPASFMQSFAVLKYNESYKTSSEPSIERTRYFVVLLEQLNFCTNFFLYVCCSSTFRKEMTRILCKTKQAAASSSTPRNSCYLHRIAINQNKKSDGQPICHIHV